MNRKQFLGSLAAMFAAPFVREEQKERPIQVGDCVPSTSLKLGEFPTTITVKGKDLRMVINKNWKIS